MRIASLVLATVVALSALPFAASLSDSAAGERDQDLFIRPSEQRSVLFASVDMGRSVFAAAGAKQTLVGPLDQSGFVVMEANGTGLTRERVGDLGLQATRFTTQSAVMLGYQMNRDGFFVAGFLGPEIEHEQLTVDGRVGRVADPRFGARAQIELWANPTRDTMITGTIVGSSAHQSLWARGSAGYRVLDGLYAGPEVVSYVTGSYRETKVGAHLTGLRAGIVEGRLSAGWAMANDGRTGSAYVGLAAWIRM